MKSFITTVLQLHKIEKIPEDAGHFVILKHLQSVQIERVLDFSKTIKDFKTFFLKIKVLSKDYGATT